MNVARVFLSLIAGLSAALIAFSAAFVRGDVGGVMSYLHHRAALRRLGESGASTEQLARAKADLLALGQAIAAPELATRLVPLELLLGVLVGLLVWWLFGQRVQKAAAGKRPDIQERMVLRFAHRMGGTFTLRDLLERGPLSAEQARETTARMLERGELRRTEKGLSL